MIDSKLTTGNVDDFQEAQQLLVHSYKDANVAEAVKRFQAVPKTDPNYALAQARLGAAYLVQYKHSHDAKLLDEAKEATILAMHLNSNLAVPYVTLSLIAAMQGDTQMATQQAEKAIQLDGNDAEGYGALGEVLEAEGRQNDALAKYNKAIDLAPEDWRWPVARAGVRIRRGRYCRHRSRTCRWPPKRRRIMHSPITT